MFDGIGGTSKNRCLTESAAPSRTRCLTESAALSRTRCLTESTAPSRNKWRPGPVLGVCMREGKGSVHTFVQLGIAMEQTPADARAAPSASAPNHIVMDIHSSPKRPRDPAPDNKVSQRATPSAPASEVRSWRSRL
eukprot:scaffold1485_cov124-Isochrysis_galbana.AAC.2